MLRRLHEGMDAARLAAAQQRMSLLNAPRLMAHRAAQRVQQGNLPQLSIHVFSDISCPWCHIGAQRIKRTVRRYKRMYGHAAPVVVTSNPLLVDSSIPPEGETVEAYAERRWGPGAADSWRARLSRAGLPEQAPFDDWRFMPSSLLAHELIALASTMGLGELASDLIFARTYEQGANVSELDELLTIAAVLGMPPDFVRQELTRGEGSALRASVLERDAAAKERLRITAAPHVIVAAGPLSRSKYALSGAAAMSGDLLGAMQRVAFEELSATAAASGPAAQMALLRKPAAGLQVLTPVPVAL